MFKKKEESRTLWMRLDGGGGLSIVYRNGEVYFTIFYRNDPDNRVTKLVNFLNKHNYPG